MFRKINLLISVILFLETINALPQYYHSYQTNSAKTNVPSYYQGQSSGLSYLINPFSGVSHQGFRPHSNYNSFIPIQNRPNSGVVLPLNYNIGSNDYKYLLNRNPQQEQQQQHKNYFYTNNNNNNINPWQKLNPNNNYNKPYNRYAVGSTGWFATGGSYLNNDVQRLTAYACLLIINIFILAICK